MNPDLAEAHFNLVGIYLAKSPADTDLALAHYEKAISLGSQRDPSIEARIDFEDGTPDILLDAIDLNDPVTGTP